MALGRSSGASGANVILGAASVLVGAWTRTASASFQRIVDTEGRDIENLMFAIGELRRIYALQRGLLVVVMLFAFLAAQLYLLFVASGH
jgi:hypothetical protein